MHLREVMLRNWRSYRAVRFAFPAPTSRKRVLLVGAMNGTGKTSLLVGLYLGLFGREAMQYVEGVKLGSTEEERFKSYRQLVQQLLHRPALDQEDPHASVDLLFDVAGRHVRVTRTWFYTKGGAPRDLESEGEEVRLTVDNKPVRVSDWRDANNKIAAELFPAHVMSCFFFDGEQAQARVEGSGAAAMSEAIRVLFGTGLLSELDDSLKTFIANERTSLKRDVGDLDVEALDRKRRRRDEIEDDLSKLRKDLKKVRLDLENITAARKEKITELTQLTGDATVDTAQIAQRKAELESQEREINERLQKALSDLALPLAIAKHGKRIGEVLAAEIIRDRWLLLRDATQEKVSHILDAGIPKPGEGALSPPLNQGQYTVLLERMEQTLQSLWHPPPDGCAPDYTFRFLGTSERQVVRERVQAIMATGVADVGELVSARESIRSKVRDARRQWDAVSDYGPKIEQIKTRVTELDEKVRELGTRKGSLETRERGLSSELKELQATIGQMESAKRKLGPAEQKLDVAERVRSVIGDVQDQLMPLCKKSLEEACTRHFREMISEEYRGYHVEFDGDLQPTLIGNGGAANGTPIYVTTLSGAQKRAFGLAFTLAVAEVSGAEAPLVIDTPVGNADSEYRTRMLTYLAKAAKGQVIFLSHDLEIYGPYAYAIEPYLLKKYLVSFEKVGEGAGISSVIENKYFA